MTDVQTGHPTTAAGSLLLIVAGVIACVNPGASRAATTPGAPRQAPTRTALGTVVGRVVYSGPRPSVGQIAVDVDRQACGEAIIAEDLLVADRGGLANVVVRIDGASPPATPRREGVALPRPQRAPVGELSLAHRGCVHRPHLQAAYVPPSGLTLSISNEDGILHNVHAWRDNDTLFNRAQPPAAGDIRVHLEAWTGAIVLHCNLHGWTSGYIFLVEHPYFAISEPEGTFRITDVPPGTHMVVAWHEKLGTVTAEVEVTPGASTTVAIEMKRTPLPSSRDR